MAEKRGYAIIRGAIPRDLAQKAVDALSQGPTETRRREKYIEYEVPPVCFTIKDEFVTRADQSALAELYAPESAPKIPKSVDVGKFRETKFDPNKFRSAQKGDIYVTIALTPLSSSNGWFVLYEGSRNQSRQKSSIATTKETQEEGSQPSKQAQEPNTPTQKEAPKQNSPPLRPVDLKLDAGDAVVWRGDLVYIDPPGGGGMFETLTYRR